MKIALCILTRNERPCLEQMLPRLLPPGQTAAYDAWAAIDGASTDGTVELLANSGIPVVQQTRRGRSAALLEAIERIDADAYVFFSPDGNEDPADLPRFRAALIDGNDLVIASRMMPGAVNEEDSQTLRWRKWANQAFNFCANMLFRKTERQSFVTDSINGYRAITRVAAQRLALDATDYTIEYQMTIRALKAGLRITEFATCEGQRIAGNTGAPSIQTGLLFCRRLWDEWTRAAGAAR